MTAFTELLGARIRGVRKSKGLTQDQLAEAAGISTKYLSEVERGVCNVSAEILHKIAFGLGVEFRDLLDLEQEAGREALEKYLVSLIREASDERLEILRRVVAAVLV